MDVEILIDQLRLSMERMAGWERIELVGDLMDGYCLDCGEPTFGRPCYCTNDE